MRLRPGLGGRAAMTSSAPAIWGTYFGWTKLTASIRRAPAASSRRTRSARTAGSQDRLFVLQAVAGTDLDDRDGAAHRAAPDATGSPGGA